MSFEPIFMLQHEEYLAEKQRVRSVEDWQKFAAKWFDRSNWPEKDEAQLAEEAPLKRGPVRLGGRLWGYTFFIYDLSPEARCEYLTTVRTLGDPILFPDAANREKVPEEGWSQRCPYCEISTYEMGDETCPQCGHALAYTCTHG
jgi:hypothetical protein